MRTARMTAALTLAAALLVLPSCASTVQTSGVSTNASKPAEANPSGPAEATPAATSGPRERDLENLDACAILTQTDAETLMGRELSEPLPANNPDVASCTYPGGLNGPTVQSRSISARARRSSSISTGNWAMSSLRWRILGMRRGRSKT